MKGRQVIFSKIGKVLALTLLATIFVTAPGQFNHPVLAQQQDTPLMFIENVGQFPLDEQTRFLVSTNQMTLRLADDALWVTVVETPATNLSGDAEAITTSLESAEESRQGVNLRLSFVDANPQPRLEPFNQLDIPVSFFKGSDPAQWRTEVPVWGGVRYVDLYPGLDLEVTGENGQLVPRLVVQEPEGVTALSSMPLEQVRLQVEGADGVAVDEMGRLHLTTAIGEVNLPLLQAVTADNQLLAAPVAPAEVTAAGEIAMPFALSAEVPVSSQPPSMTIAGTADLVYSTFLGGPGLLETGLAITIDEAGYAYVTGQAYPGFPTTPGVFDTTIEGDITDAYIAKLSPDGSELIFATYIGGNEFEYSRGIVVDGDDSVYITGNTHSPDFPTTSGAMDETLDGTTDAYVLKLNSTGTGLLYSTLIGGSNGDFGWDLVVDDGGYVYGAGTTLSPDFPVTPGAFDQMNDFGKAYIFKLSPDGSELIYATYLGGSKGDYGYGLAVDETGSAFVAGWTVSSDFPVTTGAFDTDYVLSEGYLAKLTPDGSGLEYATFIGGSKSDVAGAVAVDEAGNAYLTGYTGSPDFPITPGAFDDACTECDAAAPRADAFVAKFNPDGSNLVYASYLGGNSYDYGNDIAVSASGAVYIAGQTVSEDFPTTPNAFDLICDSCGEAIRRSDAFVVRVTPAGTALAYSTFLGGSGGGDWADGLAIDGTGQVYVVGTASSSSFPITEGVVDPIIEGNDAFVAKLATGSDEPPPPPAPVPAHDCAPSLVGEIIVGDTPRGVAVDSARQRVYVTNFGSDSVSVIDSNTNTVLQTLTGLASANGLAYDAANNLIWVTNYDLKLVTPIQANDDATDFAVRPAISVGDGPWGVVYQPVHNYVYVANSLANSVSVIDAGTQAVIATLSDSFDRPFHLAANPVTGKVYAANFGNNSVSVIEGTAVSKVVQLWDSGRAYGLAVDETRNLVYVATIHTNRIVALGPLFGQPDQFLGWAAFQRGFNPNRRVPLRVIAVNPDLGSPFDGGHVWATTATVDGSEANQALFIPKGWSSYFHAPFARNVGADPTDGIAIDRETDRVYITSGTFPGTLTVIGDHNAMCPGIAPAAVAEDTDQINFDIFSVTDLARSDVTGDGQVNLLDLALVASRYGQADDRADLNGDGTVDILDLAFVANYYHQRLP